MYGNYMMTVKLIKVYPTSQVYQIVTFTYYLFKLTDQQRAKAAFKILRVTAAQTGFPN